MVERLKFLAKVKKKPVTLCNEQTRSCLDNPLLKKSIDNYEQVVQ